MFITLDQGMAQKTLIYKLTWFVIQEGRKLYKKWTHYDAMINDTWAIEHEILKKNSIKEYINQISFYLFTTVQTKLKSS